MISAAGSGRACQLPAGKTSILNSLAGGMIPVMPLLFSGEIPQTVSRQSAQACETGGGICRNGCRLPW